MRKELLNELNRNREMMGLSVLSEQTPNEIQQGLISLIKKYYEDNNIPIDDDFKQIENVVNNINSQGNTPTGAADSTSTTPAAASAAASAAAPAGADSTSTTPADANTTSTPSTPTREEKLAKVNEVSTKIKEDTKNYANIDNTIKDKIKNKKIVLMVGSHMNELKVPGIMEAIAYVQTKVNAPITGIFDKATKDKVVEFQKSNNLTQDGIVGPLTIEKLVQS